MHFREIKSKIDFYEEALYQHGYDLGWNAALETMQVVSDALWNNGDSATGEALRDVLQRVRREFEEVE